MMIEKQRLKRAMRNLLLGAGVGGAMLLPATGSVGAEADMAADARAYQVVPCLLPARIRKLGRMTYPERRKLVEVTSRNCELKGGEYTFYDRAQPESAVKFFKKLADEGDVDAQLSLGDVYQYLFTPARYEDAIQWYQLAAQGGNGNAKMQLARLYERGLGVEKDGLAAVNLWREATGAGEELVLASELEAAKTEADLRIAQLTEQLQQRNEAAEEVRRQLQIARQEVSKRKQDLAAAEQNLTKLRTEMDQVAKNTADPEEAARLRREIATQQRVIDDQQFRIDSLEGDVGVQTAQLAANLKQVERQNKRLEEELARVNASADETLEEALAQLSSKDEELSRLKSDLANARNAVADSSGAFESLTKQLEESRASADQASAKSRRQLAQLEEQHAAQSAELAQRREQMAQLEVALASVSEDAAELRGQLDGQVKATSKAQADFARSEADLARTREELAQRTAKLEDANTRLASIDSKRQSLATALAQAQSSGASSSAAIEGQLQEQQQKLREQRAMIAGLQAEVDDYRGQLQEISVRRASYATRSPIEDTSKLRLPRNVKVGRFHSLVFGNNDYQYLDDLQNAANDAKSVHELLRDGYGFRSKLIVDATRLDMFQAIAGLIDTTGPDDLVLIYYAGHGVSDRDQSYWLPVDVRSRQEAPGTGLASEEVANWIKNIPAKHVMIIADSCYSGSGITAAAGFKYSAEDLEVMLPYLVQSRSRTMLTSGGDGPVMDGGGESNHSVFTRELLALLNENKGVMHGEQVFTYLVERVKYTVDGDEINQTPTFGSIERAGHESGQFVFMRKGVRS